MFNRISKTMGAGSSKNASRGEKSNYEDAYEVFYRISQGHATEDEGEVEIQQKSNVLDDDVFSNEPVDETTNFYHDLQYDDCLKDEYPEWVIIEIRDLISPQEVVTPQDTAVVKEVSEATQQTDTPPVARRKVSFLPSGQQDIPVIPENKQNPDTNQYQNNIERDIGSLSPAFSMESFMSGTSTATNATYTSVMCDDSVPCRIQTYMKYSMKDWSLCVGIKQAQCPLQHKYQDRKVYWQVYTFYLKFE